MANAYFIINLVIHNPEGMKPYQEKVAETYPPYGGKLLVLGGKSDVLEGTGPQGLTVILEFPSMEQAHAWHDSPEYQAIIGYRLAAAESNAYLVEGLALTAHA
ncbi:DUF1330 domain-containing protein [Kluyvera ascorbata]|uniref:DUF1330 domain-containing protein n=1 Tax=Kluyvera ascorbata TaxID=51288 RepID=UPI0028A10272|nr:DUF1330 domain-containing protein [Kluyvera ascorbata]